MVVGVLEGGAPAHELGAVAGDRVAAAFLVGAVDRVDLGGLDGLVLDAQEAHLVGQVERRRRARGDADRGAGEILEGGGAPRLADRRRVDHHALAVVEDRGPEVAPQAVALERVRGVAEDDVHLAALDGGGALVGRELDVLDGVRVAQDGGRDGAAVVGVHAVVLVGLRVEDAHAGQAAIDAADELAALLHGCQGAALGGYRRGGQDEGSDDEPGNESLHAWGLLSLIPMGARRPSVRPSGEDTGCTR